MELGTDFRVMGPGDAGRADLLPLGRMASSPLCSAQLVFCKIIFRGTQVLRAVLLLCKLCMTCTVNKAENVSIQNMMVILPTNLELQEKEWLIEKAEVCTEHL